MAEEERPEFKEVVNGDETIKIWKLFIRSMISSAISKTYKNRRNRDQTGNDEIIWDDGYMPSFHAIERRIFREENANKDNILELLGTEFDFGKGTVMNHMEKYNKIDRNVIGELYDEVLEKLVIYLYQKSKLFRLWADALVEKEKTRINAGNIQGMTVSTPLPEVLMGIVNEYTSESESPEYIKNVVRPHLKFGARKKSVRKSRKSSRKKSVRKSRKSSVRKSHKSSVRKSHKSSSKKSHRKSRKSSRKKSR